MRKNSHPLPRPAAKFKLLVQSFVLTGLLIGSAFGQTPNTADTANAGTSTSGWRLVQQVTDTAVYTDGAGNYRLNNGTVVHPDGHGNYRDAAGNILFDTYRGIDGQYQDTRPGVFPVTPAFTREQMRNLKQSDFPKIPSIAPDCREGRHWELVPYALCVCNGDLGHIPVSNDQPAACTPPAPTLAVVRNPTTAPVGSNFNVSWNATNAWVVTYTCTGAEAKAQTQAGSAPAQGGISNSPNGTGARTPLQSTLSGTYSVAGATHCVWTATGLGGSTSVVDDYTVTGTTPNTCSNGASDYPTCTPPPPGSCGPASPSSSSTAVCPSGYSGTGATTVTTYTMGAYPSCIESSSSYQSTPSTCQPPPPGSCGPARASVIDTAACPAGWSGTGATTVTSYTMGAYPGCIESSSSYQSAPSNCQPPPPGSCGPASPSSSSTATCPSGYSGTGATTVTTYTMGAYPGCVQTSSSTVTAASTCTPPPVCPLLPPDTPPGSCPSGYTGTPAHTVTTGQNPTTCAAITTTVASTCTPTPVTTHCDAMGAGWSGNGFIISVGGTITSGGGTCSSTALCQVGQTGGPIVTTYDVVSGGYSKSGVCQPELCPPADPPKTVPSSCPAGWSGSGAITTITYTRGAYPGCVQTDDGGKETTASTCMPPKCANGASDYPTCTPPTCANGATDYPTCTPPTCANGGTNYPTCTPPPVITTLTCADYGLTGSGFITSTNGVVTSAGGTCSSTVYCAANETGGPIVTTINVAAGTSSTTGAACQVKMANCPGGSTIIDTNPIMAPGSKICRFSWPAISNGSWANGSCSGQGVWMICSPGTYSCSNGSLNILVPESCIDQTGGL